VRPSPFCLLLKRQALCELGAFDAALVTAERARADYCLRIRAAGKRVALCAGAFVFARGDLPAETPGQA